MKVKAIWSNQVIAESEHTEVVENNHYFPVNSVKKEYLKKNDHHTTCPWKGEASYFDVVVDGNVNKNAAWYYPNPKTEAKQIENYIAFWKGVQIIKDK